MEIKSPIIQRELRNATNGEIADALEFGKYTEGDESILNQEAHRRIMRNAQIESLRADENSK